ncbi:MAG: hypothetical protein AAB604_01065 [Patescibacteria group bacterium]
MTGIRAAIEEIGVLPEEMEKEIKQEQKQEDLDRWESEGGMPQKSAKPPSEGQLFLERRFLNALWAQTILGGVTWQQTGSELQVSSSLYKEYWETIIHGVRIVMESQRLLDIVGSGLFSKGSITVKTSRIQMFIYYSDRMWSLDVGRVLTTSFLLFQEIKEQQERQVKKWRHEQLQDQGRHVPEQIDGLGSLLDILAKKFGMPEIA